MMELRFSVCGGVCVLLSVSGIAFGQLHLCVAVVASDTFKFDREMRCVTMKSRKH